MRKIKLIAIIGPTGSGKTDYALRYFNTEEYALINADTLQFYTDLEIGNNKGEIRLGAATFGDWQSWYYPAAPLLECWGFNFLELTESISVADYQTKVFALFENLSARKKIPVLVGGSGLYLTAIINHYQFSNYHTNETAIEAERARIQNLTRNELVDLLFENDVDLSDLNESDQANPRRLQNLLLQKRLETLPSTNAVPADYPQNDWQIDTEIVDLGKDLVENSEEFRTKLKSRIEKMFTEGLIAEIQNIYPIFHVGELAPQIINAVGYKQLLAEDPLQESSELIDSVLTSHLQLVKKQLRWNRKYLTKI